MVEAADQLDRARKQLAEARAAYANPAVNEPAEFQLIGYLDTALVPGRGALGGLTFGGHDEDERDVAERYEHGQCVHMRGAEDPPADVATRPRDDRTQEQRPG